MTPHRAQRLRFGILAARHEGERWRLTDWQVDDVEGMRESGWLRRDSQEAFDREAEQIAERERLRKVRRDAWQKGYWAGVDDERISEGAQMAGYGPNRVNPYGR